MKYVKTTYVLRCFLWLLLWATYSCDNTLEITTNPHSVKVNLPDGISETEITNDTLSYYDISTGITVKIPADAMANIPDGFYNIYYKADLTPTDPSSDKQRRLRGALEAVVIDETHPSFTMDTHLLIDKDDFIIEEIFFTGTLRPSGKQYNGDSFVKIYNNTDHVLYADGLAFVESKFLSTKKYIFNPDIQKDTMTVHAIYVIPGSGKDHPVQPGESLLLCDTGIDHKMANPNSFDLSQADFEWYDISSSSSHMDIDSELVPNLDKWYCYTLSFFVLHNRGFHSYALARIPIDKETYLKEYFYKYRYLESTPSGNFPMNNSAYKLPNDWITDGVNCSVEAMWQWNILPVTIDGGWTHCGTIDKDKTRYFKSVRRKMIALDEAGHRILQDTDNSTDDFNTECIPSIVEEQQTSVNAEGEKAQQRTYDGVQVVKE